MASSDPPPTDEQALGTESELSDCPSKCPDTRKDVTASSTPPLSEDSAEYTNKRKRESKSTIFNNVKETEAVKDIPVAADMAETKEELVGTVKSVGTGEIEMKDAECVDRSAQQGIKDIEMQDAEVVCDKKQADGTDVLEEGKMHNKDDMGSNPTATEGCKQDQGIKETEQPSKDDVCETDQGIEKRSIDAAAATTDGSEQKALGEVATLLKQVQQSDAKAKLEVEVKVMKVDHGDVKEDAGISEN